MECLRNKFSSGVLLDGGRYKTISPLNHGSFGMVFLAQDLHNNQTVAIKCLTKQSAPNDAGLDLSVDDRSEEHALHSSLGLHPNIVNLLGKFETDSHLYLVMEYCSQGDLYEAIRNCHGPLQTEHVRQFMLQLVDAVAYIHSRSIFHRDIKPENIFLTHDGVMKLGDFGLATTDKWSYEMTVGSDRYMAPEQFDSAGDGYSPAGADIWAIGICLLNTLFSRNPFTTPTEADPIFLDFSKDKQSLFDVFPTMSQDTYEVIVECMNLDPRRRSLEGARDALLRVVSFTTEDESLDDFCCSGKAIVVSAHREPLRTPSIQSPHVEANTSFPWARVLHEVPARRQLSAIPDDESYTEDLFSKSGEPVDWCSASVQTTPSSMPESHLGASVQSHVMSKPFQPYKVSPAAGSLPITMGKPFVSAMSTIFGQKKDNVSKSWSEMWDEDEEEEREQQKLVAFQDIDSRTWSHESGKEMARTFDKVEATTSSLLIKGDVDDDLVADGFFFQDSTPSKQTVGSAPRFSLRSKRQDLDKWAALGERRRGGLSQSMEHEKPIAFKKRPVANACQPCESGLWDHSSKSAWGKDRFHDSPLNRAKEWNWRRDRRPDLATVEWVGGW